MARSDYNPRGRPFTGRGMALTVAAFFGVIFAVNGLMAYLAVKNFRGAVVDSGFVASQDFNATNAAQAAQDARGWTVGVEAPDGRPVLRLTGPDGAPLAGLTVTAAALRPLDRDLDAPLTLAETAPGVWTAAETLAPGRWRLAFTARGLGPDYVASRPMMVEAR